MSFVSDLKLGQYYEEKYIEKRGFGDYYHPKDIKFKDYDFKNNETGKTYEVKADKKTCDTGNLFIEIMCNGEDSGIYSTKADYWVHFICKSKQEPYKSDYFYKIKVKELIPIVNKSGRYFKGAGDGNRVVGYLLNENYLKDYKHDYSI